ncbi:acyltransferase [Paenibacillus sp. HJGM_3]|uniref:acyltransferase n=1 Tax=Paenibacillus sp. HJGM_3 TaxID=3379816 RepID=UPI00385A4F9C
MKRYWNEIGITRGVAIAGVVSIHATSQASVRFSEGSSLHFIYSLLNKWGHFSVPVFILLSGLALTNRYMGAWNLEGGVVFYKRRWMHVVVPYVLWSFLYQALHLFLYNEELSVGSMLLQLVSGTAHYHLYFMILIIQYYLLFPIILAALRPYSRASFLLVAVAVIIQAAAGKVLYEAGWEDKSWLFTTYLAFFVVGCVMGAAYERWRPILSKYVPFTLGAALVLLVVHLVVGMWHLYESDYAGLWVRETIVYGYSFFAAWFLLGIGQRLNEGRWGMRLLRALGQASFGIYLMHPALLSLLDQLPYPSGWSYHAAVAIRFTLALLVSYLLTRFLRGLKGVRILVGK